MRKGAVLLVVLLFMFAISVLLMHSMSISQKAFEDANRIRFMTQTNLMLNSLRGVIDKFLSKVNNAEALFVLENMPFFFNDSKSDVNFEIKFTSGASKLNINRLLDTNESMNSFYFDVFDNLLSKYNVADRRFLFSLILDTIDKDKEEREYSTEIANINDEFKDGGIIDFEQFEKLLEHYEYARSDSSVYNVPWREFITFKGEQIDLNHAHKELIEAVLDGNTIISNYLEREDYIKSLDGISLSDEEKSRLSMIKMELFAPIVECRVDFSAFGDSVKANFLYDLKKKSVYDFEISY